MNQSRSLDAITTEFLSNAEMEELSPNDRKFIINQFKKLYSQQMSKLATEITKRNQIKANKTDIEQKEELQIKSIQENLNKKMQIHTQKREKAFSKKANHFKLLDQNWKFKMEEIQRKRKEEYKQSLEKAAQYRKQIESFWTENKKKNKSITLDQNSPVIDNDGYFSIRAEIGQKSNKHLKPETQLFYKNKRKTQSKNELSSLNKSLLPNIQKKSYYLSNVSKKKDFEKIPMHQSQHRFANEKSIQQCIEKSKHLNDQKEEFALQKALEKLKMIQSKRKKCKQDRQKGIKEAKLKRELRQEAMAHAQRRQNSEQQEYQQKSSSKNKKVLGSSIEAENGTLSRSLSKRQGEISLSQSIVKHKKAKQQIEEQKFSERGEILKANLMKQKKGKIIRLVKETINKFKLETLKEVI